MLAADRIARRAADGKPVRLRFPPDALVVVGGIPGAGKTTFLRRVFAAGPAVVLDSEDVAHRLQAKARTRRGYRVLRPLVHAIHWLRIERALRGDRPVVVHETATRAVSRRALAARARRHGRTAHLLLLDVEPALARDGQVARGRTVPEASMARHVRRARALHAELADGPPEGFASARVLPRTAADGVAAVHFVAAV